MLKGFTREEKSWMLYDWANSAFSAIVAAIILPIFFKEIAKGGGVADVDATAYCNLAGHVYLRDARAASWHNWRFQRHEKEALYGLYAAWCGQYAAAGFDL